MPTRILLAAQQTETNQGGVPENSIINRHNLKQYEERTQGETQPKTSPDESKAIAVQRAIKPKGKTFLPEVQHWGNPKSKKSPL